MPNYGDFPTGRIPDVMFIGTSRCGLSATLKFLSSHSQIFYGGTGIIDQSSVEADVQLFYKGFGVDSGQGQILVERNPKLYLAPETAGLITKINPNMKVVFLGRSLS